VLKINEVVSEVLSEVVLNIVTLLKTRPIIDTFQPGQANCPLFGREDQPNFQQLEP
jgi:hypothetical protein